MHQPRSHNKFPYCTAPKGLMRSHIGLIYSLAGMGRSKSAPLRGVERKNVTHARRRATVFIPAKCKPGFRRAGAPRGRL